MTIINIIAERPGDGISTVGVRWRTLFSLKPADQSNEELQHIHYPFKAS